MRVGVAIALLFFSALVARGETFTVTATAVGGGSVDSASKTVEAGGGVSFTATADAGKELYACFDATDGVRTEVKLDLKPSGCVFVVLDRTPGCGAAPHRKGVTSAPDFDASCGTWYDELLADEKKPSAERKLWSYKFPHETYNFEKSKGTKTHE